MKGPLSKGFAFTAINGRSKWHLPEGQQILIVDARDYNSFITLIKRARKVSNGGKYDKRDEQN